MAIVTTSNLVGELQQLQLLGPVYENELTTTLAGRFPDARSLAQELVRRSWLTPFQANRLFNGRGRELILGQYVLLEQLGEGGMGAVFKARHRMLKRIDAVKVIRPERLADPANLERFRREMEAAARLRHPNLVAVYNADQVGNVQYLAMEYLEGTDLGKLVKAQPQGLPVGQACDYIRQACLGLQHAHENRLIHRDIKPTNLHVSLPGEGRDRPHTAGTVKVLDLGLARVEVPNPGDEGGTLTAPGALMGTPDYMSPEQINDPRSVDARSDVYSMGCTFYHLLAGHAPFAGGHWTEKLRQHCEGEPVPVQKGRPDVPAGVAAVLVRMMAKRPGERYQTPLEVALALAPFCEAPQAVAVTVERGTRRPVEIPPSTAPGDLPQAIVSTDQRGQTLEGDATTPEVPAARVLEIAVALPARGGRTARPDEEPEVRVRVTGGSGQKVKIVVLLGSLLVLCLAGLFAGIKLAGSKDSEPGDTDSPANNDKKGEDKKGEVPKPPDNKPTLVVAQKGGGDFASIHAALADSRLKEGMRLRVRPGVYTDPLVLYKNVEIVGDGPREKIVIECKDGNCINVLTDAATVRGLTIRCRKLATDDRKFFAINITRGQVVFEDCAITSESPLACVRVMGTDARPVLRKCLIHDGTQTGLFVADKAEPTVEDCEFRENGPFGVHVTGGANPVVRRCKVHGSKDSGIYVSKKGQGRFEDCESYGNAAASVEVTEESTPTFVRCKIRDGKQGGIFVLEKGAGTFEDCDIFGHAKSGVEIRNGGNPLLRKCRIYEAKVSGVLVHTKGAGQFESCDIYGNAHRGVDVQEQGDPTFKGCKIHDNKRAGVLSADGGKGTFLDCDIYGHPHAGVVSQDKGNPTLRDCRIKRNAKFGVAVIKESEATVQDCDLRDNLLGAFSVDKDSTLHRSNNKE